jgi:hypothetical protein
MTVSLPNGSFVTSQLPIAQNVASTDRLLCIYNAANNPLVGNGTASTRTIPVMNLVYSISNNISLMAWTNAVTLSNTSNNYNAALTDCYIFVYANNAGNVTVTIPSIAHLGQGFVVVNGNISNSNVFVTSTPNTGYTISMANTYQLNNVVSLVLGPSNNFWVISKI